MPRKTKDQKDLENKTNTEEVVKKAPAKKKVASSSTKKATTATKSEKAVKATKVAKSTKVDKSTKTASDSKTANKTKIADKKPVEKKSVKKSTTTKKASASKKTTDKKAVTKKVATKSTKASTSKKKSTTTKKKTTTTRTRKRKADIVEYYDLPYRYNQTIVKVLAQTPTNLFIYWDISDKDRKNFQKEFGENFFEITRPVLIVHNDTLNYTFEVEINDFANSWYLHVADAKCDYRIELGRRPIVNIMNPENPTEIKRNYNDYIFVSSSNEIESPNDKILFNKQQKMVYFRNIKTGKETPKEIASISFIRNMGKIYNIYDLYKAMYQDENIEELYNTSNPSSGNPSSGSLSSKFK